MDRQCSSCGGFCRKSGCERENVEPTPDPIYTAPPQQREPEQVGYFYQGRFSTEKNAPGIGIYGVPVYTTLPQREWVGLTDEEEEHIVDAYWNDTPMFIEAIEAKLKEKNNG